MEGYKLTRTGNVVTIKDLQATYTIIYGVHLRGQKVEHIPADLDALFLETGTFGWFENPEKCVKALKNHMQYRPIFETLESKHISIIFGDLKYKYNDHLLLLADNAFSSVQWIAGIRMLQNIFAVRKQNPQKRSPGEWLVYAGVAGWLLVPFAANMLHLASTFIGKGEGKTAALKKFSHRLHPEADLLYLSLRNAVIAEKVTYFAKTFTKRPHIGLILGAGHVGIEDMITTSSQKRFDYLKSFGDLLQRITKKDYLSTILTVKFQGNDWKRDKIAVLNRLAYL